MEFYIHLRDPGFPEGPWPGERRLGPYPESEDAAAQAVSDLANGTMREEDFVGIYPAEESEKAAGDAKAKRKAEITPSALKGRVQTMRKRMAAQRLVDHQDNETDLKRILPEGVSWAALQEYAKQMREAASLAARQEAP